MRSSLCVALVLLASLAGLRAQEDQANRRLGASSEDVVVQARAGRALLTETTPPLCGTNRACTESCVCNVEGLTRERRCDKQGICRNVCNTGSCNSLCVCPSGTACNVTTFVNSNTAGVCKPYCVCNQPCNSTCIVRSSETCFEGTTRKLCTAEDECDNEIDNCVCGSGNVCDSRDGYCKKPCTVGQRQCNVVDQGPFQGCVCQGSSYFNCDPTSNGQGICLRICQPNQDCASCSCRSGQCVFSGKTTRFGPQQICVYTED